MPRKWNCNAEEDQQHYRIGGAQTHAQGTFAEDDDIHIERFQVGLTVGILVE